MLIEPKAKVVAIVGEAPAYKRAHGDLVLVDHLDQRLDPDIAVFWKLNLNDVVGFLADSVANLVTASHEAVDDYILTCERVGKAPEKAYSGNVMFRISPEVHARAGPEGRGLDLRPSPQAARAALHRRRTGRAPGVRQEGAQGQKDYRR